MNLLSHSNGIYKMKKEKLSMMEIIKRAAIIFLALVVFGFVIQSINNVIDNTKLKSRFKYVRIDGKKMEYKLKGNGSYTVVLDGAIGTTLYQWDEVCKSLEDDKDITTFIYNRRGYGFNDGGELRSPEEQAKDLKLLLKKAGAPEPYILVSEEYGSLVAANFAKLYPDSIVGAVMINPLSQERISSKEVKSSIQMRYYRSLIESAGSSISLTALLDKIGLVMDNDKLEESLSESEKEEFEALKNKKSYRSAVSNELKNVYKNSAASITEEQGVFEKKSLYVISDNENDQVANMGDPSYTTVYSTDVKDVPYSVEKPESIIVGINTVIKQAKKIARSQ